MKNPILLITALCVSQAFAQNGDKMHPSKQIEPIPAEEIPPSPYLNLEDSMKAFKIAEGFKLEPIAHGKLVTMPVALDFDEDGRAWVVEMRNYMLDLDARDENAPTGQIRILEDSNGDGKLDKATVFMDDLILPRAVAVCTDGVLFCSDDKLCYVKRDGLKPVGKIEIIDHKYASGGNAEHKANGLLRGLDNWYYNAKSYYRYRKIDGKWVKDKTFFRGQWGIAQDSYGRLYYNHNSALLQADYYRPGLSFDFPNVKLDKNPRSNLSKKVHPIRINPGVNRGYTGILDEKTGKLYNVTAAAGMTIYRGQNFPKKYQGNSLTAASCVNTVAMLDMQRKPNQSVKAKNPLKNKDIIASTDEWFRPVNLYTAPDGSVWVLDLHFGLIQHKTYMTSYLRDQYESRGLDKPEPNNGRIYRLSYPANPLGKVPKLSAASDAELVKFLGHENGTVRDKAQRLLVEKLEKADDSLSQEISEKALKAGLETESELQMIHILWTLESIQKIPNQLLEKALSSSSDPLKSVALELWNFSETPMLDQLIGYDPSEETLHSYCFALGAHASKEAIARMDAIIKKFPRSNRKQDLFIVGSKPLKDASEMKGVTSGDKRLKDLLGQIHGTSEVEVKKSGEGLSGDHLASFNRGSKIYEAAACASCHGLDGEGQDATGVPPISPSSWVTGEKHILGKVILNGLTGPITVNGERIKTDIAMPPYIQNPTLKKNQDLADLLNYIRNLHTNKGSYVTEAEAKKIRKEAENRSLPWTEADLGLKK